MLRSEPLRIRARKWNGFAWLPWALGIGIVLAMPAVADQDGVPQSLERSWLKKEMARFLSYPLLDAAYRSLAEGDLEQTRKHIEHALELVPDDLDVKQQAMALMLALGDPDAVERIANEILDMRPGQGMALLYRGIARTNENRLGLALTDLEAAIRAGDLDQTHDSMARNVLADSGIRAHRYDLVAQTLAARGTGDVYRDALRLGMAYAGLKDEARALAYFETAVTGSRDETQHLFAVRSYADAALTMGMAEKALAVVKDGLKLAPTDPQLLRQLSALEERNGNLVRAAEAFEASLGRDAGPDDMERLARLRLAAGEADFAMAAAQKGLAVTPPGDNVTTLQALVTWANLAAGRFDVARKMLHDIQVSDSPQPLLELSTAFELEGLIPEALDALNLTRLEGVEIRQRRAALLEQMGQYLSAADELAPLMHAEIDREDRVEFARAAGTLYLKADAPERAEQALEFAAHDANLGADPELALTLAQAQALTGKFQMALATLKAVAINQSEGSAARIEALTRIGYLTADQQDFEAAADAFHAAFEEGGRNNPSLLRATVTAYVQLRKPDAAFALLRSVLAEQEDEGTRLIPNARAEDDATSTTGQSRLVAAPQSNHEYIFVGNSKVAANDEALHEGAAALSKLIPNTSAQ